MPFPELPQDFTGEGGSPKSLRPWTLVKLYLQSCKLSRNKNSQGNYPVCHGVLLLTGYVVATHCLNSDRAEGIAATLHTGQPKHRKHCSSTASLPKDIAFAG